MHLSSAFALTVLALVSGTCSAIVGVTANNDRAFAVALPGEDGASSILLAPRSNEPITTPADPADGDDDSKTVTITKTRALTTVTLTVSRASAPTAAAKEIPANDNPTESSTSYVKTETTVQVIHITSTTIVPMILSTVASPTSASTGAAASASEAILPLTSADGNETSTNPSSGGKKTATSSTTATSDNDTTTRSPASPTVPTTGAQLHPHFPVTESARSTVTSVAIVASATSTSTSTVEGLFGEPSAIASSLGSNGASGRGMMSRIEAVAVAALAGMGLVALVL